MEIKLKAGFYYYLKRIMEIPEVAVYLMTSGIILEIDFNYIHNHLAPQDESFLIYPDRFEFALHKKCCKIKSCGELKMILWRGDNFDAITWVENELDKVGLKTSCIIQS